MYDTLSFNTKIGYITNISTTMFAMLPIYQQNSHHKTIINRLKLCFTAQSAEIDKTKGIKTAPFPPQHWTNWQKNPEGDSLIDFQNSVLIEKRPYFFRYLYQDYDRKYRKHIDIYENFSQSKFGLSISELSKLKNKTVHQKKTIENFNKYNPLLDTDCIMNKVAHTMEKGFFDVASKSKRISFGVPLYKKLLHPYYIEFREFMKHGNHDFENKHQFFAYIRNKCIKLGKIDDVIESAYKINPKFAFSVFGNDIINIFYGRANGIIYYPKQNDLGNVEYLGKKYSFECVYLEGNEETLF